MCLPILHLLRPDLFFHQNTYWTEMAVKNHEAFIPQTSYRETGKRLLPQLNLGLAYLRQTKNKTQPISKTTG